MEWNSGPSNLCLDRVGFVPSEDADAFGFLDPELIIHACHLIPAFALGQNLWLLGRSTARDSLAGDWENYYINRYEFIMRLANLNADYLCSSFVDHDMMMRYVGTGVGHRQPADFPREDGQLKCTLTGESYVETAIQQAAESGVIQSARPTDSVEGGTVDEEDNDFGHDGDVDDDDGFDEEIYEM